MVELKTLNTDCLEFMKTCDDKQFDLAIVDPVYGELVTKGGYMNGKGGGLSKQKEYNNSIWQQQKTEKQYFTELFRVSKNQIIFGGNYFCEEIKKNSSCWIIWDKQNGENNFSDCELAWTSFKTAVRIFQFRWQGMLQGDMKNKENRIHPTQKPVALYKWLLKNYAKEGDKILDTHAGSFSSAIACYDMGFDGVFCEIDKDYYDAGLKRIREHLSQERIFEKPAELIENVKLF